MYGSGQGHTTDECSDHSARSLPLLWDSSWHSIHVKITRQSLMHHHPNIFADVTMQASLVHHLNHTFANWLVGWIQDGYRIDCKCTLKRPKVYNLIWPSALTKPEVIQDFLAIECAEGWTVGLIATTARVSSTAHKSVWGHARGHKEVPVSHGLVLLRGS